MKISDGVFSRLSSARGWVLAQFVVTLLLILAGLGWTRLPDTHVWQVALSLLIPVLLVISLLELEAATVRKLSDDDGTRVKLVWGALTLLVWALLAWACWWALDWCDDRIWQWAAYLNSKASPHARVTYFSFEHISRDFTIIEWVLRWIVVPAKIIPYAAASAQWGWRLPWRRVIRILWNWRWWLAMVFASLFAVLLPTRFFAGIPRGTVSAQVWHVGLKLGAAYLLAVSSWVLLLGWLATLFGRQIQPPTEKILVAVPVSSSPSDKSRGAVAELPPGDEDSV